MKFATNQDMFDYVTDAVIKQGQPSAIVKPISDESDLTSCFCMYRSPAGKCAAGHLIPDDRYEKRMEDRPACSLFFSELSDLDLFPTDESIDLLQSLQESHDEAARASFQDSTFNNEKFLKEVTGNFRETASVYRLTVNF